jgi:hypothetical protein
VSHERLANPRSSNEYGTAEAFVAEAAAVMAFVA